MSEVALNTKAWFLFYLLIDAPTGENTMIEQMWNGKEVTHRITGQTSTEEIKRAATKVAADFRFDEISEIIYDFTACEGVTIKHEVVEEIAALDGAASRTNPRIRITVISDHPEIIAATQAYIHSGLSSYPVRICASPVEKPWASWLTSTPNSPSLSFSY